MKLTDIRKRYTLFKIYRYDKKKYYYLTILKHKDSGKYSFVNLTKGHICPCLFDTDYDAYLELVDRRDRGELKIVYAKWAKGDEQIAADPVLG
jgi:hypothetical protein